ncbi:MAG TPA: hypothetical protein DCG53_03970 [Syntrophus sp. (in: bacteria)]|nr:hypothetical protein [Syntrophus sp. (in: bacteria)]
MTVYKFVELVGTSPRPWEDAALQNNERRKRYVRLQIR